MWIHFLTWMQPVVGGLAFMVVRRIHLGSLNVMHEFREQSVLLVILLSFLNSLSSGLSLLQLGMVLETMVQRLWQCLALVYPVIWLCLALKLNGYIRRSQKQIGARPHGPRDQPRRYSRNLIFLVMRALMRLANNLVLIGIFVAITISLIAVSDPENLSCASW